MAGNESNLVTLDNFGGLVYLALDLVNLRRAQLVHGAKAAHVLEVSRRGQQFGFQLI